MDASLPIYAALPELRARLSAHSLVIAQAPPGAGKSTVLPLELLNEAWLNGQRILMLEPRRLAARSVAARMAHTLGEAVGQTVGYHVRFERRAGPRLLREAARQQRGAADVARGEGRQLPAHDAIDGPGRCADAILEYLDRRERRAS